MFSSCLMPLFSLGHLRDCFCWELFGPIMNIVTFVVVIYWYKITMTTAALLGSCDPSMGERLPVGLLYYVPWMFVYLHSKGKIIILMQKKKLQAYAVTDTFYFMKSLSLEYVDALKTVR